MQVRLNIVVYDAIVDGPDVAGIYMYDLKQNIRIAQFTWDDLWVLVVSRWRGEAATWGDPPTTVLRLCADDPRREESAVQHCEGQSESDVPRAMRG